VIVLAREDGEMDLHAPQTKTEHFSGCVDGQTIISKNSIIANKQHLDHRMHLIT
jgi:hypothetical protein